MLESDIGTYDCAPTLDDTQVVEFCKNGFLMLDGVVPQEINERTLDYVERDKHHEPTNILLENWFLESVICNEAAAGAVRSLLGANFHLPVLISNHRKVCPADMSGGWHVDGGTIYESALNHLQVFYLPQNTPVELGPTDVLPGSHFMVNQQRFMAHYGRIASAVSTSAPAGSIFLTVYGIWHRATAASAKGVRNMLKYFYWRTMPPKRDWIINPEFDFANMNYEGGLPQMGEQFRASRDTARMFHWLCGMGDDYEYGGGQAWPLPANRLGTPYKVPAGFPSDTQVL